MPSPRHLKQPTTQLVPAKAVLPLARRSRGRIPERELKPDPLFAHSLADLLGAAKQQFREAVVRAVTESLLQSPSLEVHGALQETLRSAYFPFWDTGYKWEGMTVRSHSWGPGAAPAEWDLSLATDRKTQLFEVRMVNAREEMETRIWDNTNSPAQIAAKVRQLAERLGQAGHHSGRSRIA